MVDRQIRNVLKLNFVRIIRYRYQVFCRAVPVQHHIVLNRECLNMMMKAAVTAEENQKKKTKKRMSMERPRFVLNEFFFLNSVLFGY